MTRREFKQFIKTEDGKRWAPHGLRLTFGGHIHGGQFHNNYIYIDLETADGWRVVRTLAHGAATYGDAVAQYTASVFYLLKVWAADFAEVWAQMCATIGGR